MGFAELKERIISEAKRAAEEIIKEANGKAEGILEEANIEAENIKAIGLRDIERDMDMLKRKTLANIRLEIQRSILMEVQRAIEEIVTRALQEVIESPHYFDYLIRNISAIDLRGGEEIILSRYDFQRFGDRLLGELKKIKGKPELKISSAEIKGGFIVRSRDFDINNTLELTLENIRPEIEQQVGKILKEAETNASSV
jgi:vacuolar-type H+-ATPase subunit E/Vma4